MDLEIIEELWSVIQERKSSPRKGSYTSELLEDDSRIFEKLEEELAEIRKAVEDGRVSGREKDSLAWEVSDMVYHLLVLLAAEGAELDEVLAELRKRRR